MDSLQKVSSLLYLTDGFTTLPPNPALNRTGRYAGSLWRASARPAG